jgi:hypothetical protein
MACVALAGVALAFPVPSTLVEGWYAAGLYPVVQRMVTPIANMVPIAVFDVLLVAGGLTVIVIVWRGLSGAWRRRRLAPAGAAVWRVVVMAAAAYLVFLALWGLNYRREPLIDRIEMREGPPSPEAVVALGLQAASRLNTLHAEAHTTGWPEPPWRTVALREGFAEAQAALGGAVAVPGRLKPTLLGSYFRWVGVDGMVNPFALEVLANPDLLPFERPFVAAHEWAHLAGYADEAEASFVGWLACLRGGATAEYSGWLAMFVQIHGEIGGAEQVSLVNALAAGPRADISAMATRQRSGQVPVLRQAGWFAYDAYLRANRVDDGVLRYGAVVTMATQARFDEVWTPVRRSSDGR